MTITSLPSQNQYISQGSNSEQSLIESLITESLKIYGITMMYMPRTLVALDNILGEDRQSKFTQAVPIELYVKDTTGFTGNNAFISKFGLMLDQSATFVISRSRWSSVVANTSSVILPNRPAEGDLIWFPQADSLFEIKNVNWQNPFYQLGNLYTYELSVQLFSYSSETIATGIAGIDVFESLKSFDTTVNPDAKSSVVNNAQGGEFDAAAVGNVFTPTNPFSEL